MLKGIGCDAIRAGLDGQELRSTGGGITIITGTKSSAMQKVFNYSFFIGNKILKRF